MVRAGQTNMYLYLYLLKMEKEEQARLGQSWSDQYVFVFVFVFVENGKRGAGQRWSELVRPTWDLRAWPFPSTGVLHNMDPQGKQSRN